MFHKRVQEIVPLLDQQWQITKACDNNAYGLCYFHRQILQDVLNTT